MADETHPDSTHTYQLEAWKNEALQLAGSAQAAEALVRRVYEAGQAAGRSDGADTISALELELARLRRATVTTGS